MSGLAKVFLVINVVLAVIFLGTAATLFSVRKDWKAESEKLQAEYSKTFQAQLKELQELASKVEIYTNVASAQNAEILNLKNETKNLASKLNQSMSDLAKVTTDRDKKEALVNQRGTEIDDLAKQVKMLATNLDTARKALELANQMAQDKTGVADNMILQVAQLNEQIESLNREIASLRADNEKIKIEKDIAVTMGPSAINPPVAMIKAKIVGIKEDLIVISAGADDGVKVGMQFIISRGSRYLGDVKITRVYKDMAGGEIINMVNGQQMQEGDDASTR